MQNYSRSFVSLEQTNLKDICGDDRAKYNRERKRETKEPMTQFYNDGVERDHRSGQRLPQKDIDRRVQVRTLSPECFVRPILRDEDNIRYTDNVLDLVKILPRLVKINL